MLITNTTFLQRSHQNFTTPPLNDELKRFEIFQKLQLINSLVKMLKGR